MNLLIPALAAALLFAPRCLAETAPAPASSNLSDTSQSAEFKKLDEADDAAQLEVNKWIADNKRQRADGGGLSDDELERKIAERFKPIGLAYEEFLKKYPRDPKARLAYGNYLNDRQDERGAQVQWEKALELDPSNPALYNNLAGRYGESGPVNKAFEYSSKAIELSPKEPVYYHNSADMLYVLRRQAAGYYKISEQQVYLRCLGLYSNALWLEPQNFTFARDLAQTYYSLKPLPIDDALQAWTNALAVARQVDDRQDAYVHLARVKMLGGRFAEARSQLNIVTNESSLQAKTNLLKNIALRETSAAQDAQVPSAKQN